jgi:hypothetical protein
MYCQFNNLNLQLLLYIYIYIIYIYIYIYILKKKRKKSYLVIRFSSDLNLVIEFLISIIKSLDFAQVQNRSLYALFTIKINILPPVTCISFNMSMCISTPVPMQCYTNITKVFVIVGLLFWSLGFMFM